MSTYFNILISIRKYLLNYLFKVLLTKDCPIPFVTKKNVNRRVQSRRTIKRKRAEVKKFKAARRKRLAQQKKELLPKGKLPHSICLTLNFNFI